jgi:translation elongation factor EF-1alpha
VNGLTPFLRQCGYNMKKEVTFLPVAALYGHNIKDVVGQEQCNWYDGEALFQVRAEARQGGAAREAGERIGARGVIDETAERG